MTTPSEFDDIRPYDPEEISQVVDELSQDPMFKEAITLAIPQVPFEAIIAKAKQCKTLLEIQKTFVYSFLKNLLAKASDGMEMQADFLDRKYNYTFISNHRDIVLDSAFLCENMVDIGFENTAEVCTGDNLLVVPWIKKVVRLNKGIIVKRALGIREQLVASKELSSYIHYVINQKKDNVWIAQREGRAKDSNDRTQESIIKMLNMGGKGTMQENIKNINIVPLAISYEFDPCDFLKAKEYQLKRDNPHYKKTSADDVNSMNIGMFGYKGRIHYQAGACINEWIDSLPADISKNDFFTAVAEHIDHIIHSNYRLFANNYIASDKLRQEERFKNLYTPEEEKRFEDYLQSQLQRIDLPEPDHTFLTQKMLEMYANPLYNYLSAAEQKGINN